MFKEISAKDIDKNLISLIADEWALLSAGDKNDYNMMTVSWGFAGEIWGNDSIIALVRPQRYTINFTEKCDCFALSFYGDNKAVHKICGSMSGRDVNKTSLTKLTPIFDNNTVYFDEARLVIICKKQYADTLKKENFCDKAPLSNYASEDFHKFYIGKIEKVLVKE